VTVNWLCSGGWNSGDAEVHGLAAGSAVDLGELVVGASEADLQSFDFAEPLDRPRYKSCIGGGRPDSRGCRSSFSVKSPNQRSTWLSQDELVGVRSWPNPPH